MSTKKRPLLLACTAGLMAIGTHHSVGKTASAAPSTTSSGSFSLPRCPPNECGLNSASIEGHHLRELNLDGKAPISGGGFRIVRAKADDWDFDVRSGKHTSPDRKPSMGDECPSFSKHRKKSKKFRLEIDANGRLLATWNNTCKHVQSLTLKRDYKLPEKEYKLHFTERSLVRTWTNRGHCSYTNKHPDCYEIVHTISQDIEKMKPLCKAHDWEGGTPNGESPLAKLPDDRVHMLGEPLRVKLWKTPTDGVLLVKGELYDHENATILPNPEDENRWFHIACAGSAIAKMKLMGYDPAETRTEWKTTREQRQATLKMITAHYCDAVHPGEFTKTGQPIAFQNKRGWMRPWSKIYMDNEYIEAKWGENGATCLTQPRLQRADPSTRDAVTERCPNLEPCPGFLPSRVSRPGSPPSLPPDLHRSPDLSEEQQALAKERFQGVLLDDEEWMTFVRRR